MILNTLSCMAAGMILASAGVSVTNSWQAWSDCYGDRKGLAACIRIDIDVINAEGKPTPD